jgi:urease accessory protein
MGYATPTTALEGLLSGLAHPVIGIDHLLFILGAGVLAARLQRGALLPLLFVIASTLAVYVRAAGAAVPLGEFWVGASLALLGAVMLAAPGAGRAHVAALFALAGAVHGYALAEGIVGAESTPLYAYLAGLTVILCAIAWSSWVAARSIGKTRPALPLQRFTGIAVGLAGVWFTAQAALA